MKKLSLLTLSITGLIVLAGCNPNAPNGDTNGSSSTSSAPAFMSSSFSSSSSRNVSSSRSSSASSMMTSSARGHAGEGQFCGGIAGITCAPGLTCQYEGTYPDAGGTCVR